jgi:hypothetical protein
MGGFTKKRKPRYSYMAPPVIPNGPDAFSSSLDGTVWVDPAKSDDEAMTEPWVSAFDLQYLEDYREVGHIRMQAGTYCVGDMCYFLPKSSWDEISHMGEFDRREYGPEGSFVLNDGRIVVLFDLPDGQNQYDDSRGLEYLISSESIGITRLEHLEAGFPGNTHAERVSAMHRRIHAFGHVIRYENEFSCISVSANNPDGSGRITMLVLGDDIHIDSQLQGFSFTKALRRFDVQHSTY